MNLSKTPGHLLVARPRTSSLLLVCAAITATTFAGLGERPAEADGTKPRFFMHDLAPHKKDCTTCHESTGEKGKYQIKTATFGTGGAHAGPPIACDDAGCHANEQWTGPGVGIANSFCFNCHAHKPPVYPRVRSRGYSSFVQNGFSHEVHMKRTSNDCSVCHEPASFRNKKVLDGFELNYIQRDMTMPGHVQCAQCHSQRQGSFFVQPELTKDCATCHATSAETTQKSRFVDSTDFRVSYAFPLAKQKSGNRTLFASDFHESHAKKSKDRQKGKDCVSCHANAATNPGFVVPMPDKAACETCHNGQTAFSTLTAECNRCHVQKEERMQ